MDILFLLFVSVLIFFLISRSVSKRFLNRINRKDKYSGFIQFNPIPVEEELNKYLLDNFAFYHIIQIQDRRKFRNKLILFLKSKWFKGREGLEISDDMMLLVSATMAQISLGLPEFTFPKFDRIVIFPKRFYSEIIQHDLKGLTIYKTGVVLISWSDFQIGYSEPTDKLNVGIHEMSHALFLDYFHTNQRQNAYSNWLAVAKPIFESMKNNEAPPFLRDYAKSNIHEFWAVCVEHFFEAPIQFKEQLPELYNAMVCALNQDMASCLLKYSKVKSNL